MEYLLNKNLISLNDLLIKIINSPYRKNGKIKEQIDSFSN